jgi:histidine triad (HIT) family protein
MSTTDCVFCRIANGALPATFVYRDDSAMAIEDVNPQAPSHVLVLPVHHYANIGDLIQDDDRALLTRLIELASRLGRERGGRSGFRLVVNTGPLGGQTVDHFHLHVLAGRAMTWPPG